MMVQFEALATALQGLTRPGGLRIAVLSASTADKAVGPLPAERLYRGDAHNALMQGVRAFRASAACASCSTFFVSAKHGVVAGEQEISAYGETFAGYQQRAIRKRAQCLGVPEQALHFVHELEADLKLVLLPNDYLYACALTWPEQTTPTVVFASARVADKIPSRGRLVVVPTGIGDHRKMGCTRNAERGEFARRLLMSLAEGKRPFGEVRSLDAHRAVRERGLQAASG